VPAEQEAEVEHLINYLADSDCRMVRNGRSHDGRDGAKHVRRKYDYFRDEISSTEAQSMHSNTVGLTSRRAAAISSPHSWQNP